MLPKIILVVIATLLSFNVSTTKALPDGYVNHNKILDEKSIKMGIDESYWYELEKKYKVKKEVAFCIATSETSLGKNLKSSHNIGNVGNNDRGDKQHFKSKRDGIEAIYKTLTNKYLGKKMTIGSLSPAGGGRAPYYATSKYNWDKNMTSCLSVILGKKITRDYKIRL